MPIKFFQKMHAKVHHAAEWQGIPWLLGLIAMLDFLVMFIPSDLFLIAAILGYQARKVLFASSMVAGRVLAVVIAHIGLQRIPLETLHRWATEYHLESAWRQGQYFFEKFGPFSIGITALTPFPMLFPAAMSSVAGAPVWQIALFTFIGSAVRYTLLVVGIIAGKELYMEHFGGVKKADSNPKLPQTPPQ